MKNLVNRLNHLALIFFLGICICQFSNSCLADVPVNDGQKEFEQTYPPPVTEGALLAALSDPLPDVRTYAAAKLAADWPKDALAPIKAAYSTETFPGTRIALAWTMARLGDGDGVVALASMCRDASCSPILRVIAARAAIQFGNQTASTRRSNFLTNPRTTIFRRLHRR